MTPAIIVLFVNILFLVKIMWVSDRDRSSFHPLGRPSNWPPNSISPLPSTGRNVITALWPTNVVTTHGSFSDFCSANLHTNSALNFNLKHFPVDGFSAISGSFFYLHGSCLYHSTAVKVFYFKPFGSNRIRWSVGPPTDEKRRRETCNLKVVTGRYLLRKMPRRTFFKLRIS